MTEPGLEEKPLELAALPLAPGLRRRVLQAARGEVQVAAQLARGEPMVRLGRLYDRWLEPVGALVLGALQLGSALAMVLR